MLEKLEPIPIGRAEDLTNKKFGHLKVLYRVANYANRPAWQCQCDCGNYFVTTGKALKNGSTRSCGCAKNENHIKDHTGERYGKLTVLSMYSEKTKDNKILWQCKCDCGNTVLVRAGNLKATQSCGKCFKGDNISNQRFGKLVAIKYHHTSESSKKSIWECKCDCGTIIYVPAADLKAGRTQSCGCMRSKGEMVIGQLLTNEGIYFEKQKSFSTCFFEQTGGLALFDFYVNNEYLIEFDGIQHFKALGGWNNEEALKSIQAHDKIKNQWCKENNIPLIRIPYTHLDKISIDDLKLETSKFIITEELGAFDE